MNSDNNVTKCVVPTMLALKYNVVRDERVVNLIKKKIRNRVKAMYLSTQNFSMCKWVGWMDGCMDGWIGGWMNGWMFIHLI